LNRLLIRPGAIGDFILSLPALEALRADYTEVWCPSAVMPLARFADRAVSIAASGIDRLGLTDGQDVMVRLRAFDEIHSWYGTNRPEFRGIVAELPFRFHRSLPDRSGEHATDYYLSQVGACTGAVPRVIFTAEPKKRFAVLHPFSGSAKKNWPMRRWRELGGLLEQRMPVLWCCGPEDTLPGAIVIPDLYQLARWLATARVFVGNDSGVTHLAAASGVATVALFGPTDAAVWAPRGAGVTVIREDPLESLAAERVVLAVAACTVS